MHPLFEALALGDMHAQGEEAAKDEEAVSTSLSLRPAPQYLIVVTASVSTLLGIWCYPPVLFMGCSSPSVRRGRGSEVATLVAELL